MAQVASVIALVFDFDDTLTSDTTTRLIADRGLDPTKFWGTDVPARVKRGYDPNLAYLSELLSNVAPGRPLEGLRNADLTDFGRRLNGSFYQGLPQLFDLLRDDVRQHRDISIEFYIVSGGLKAIIDGSGMVGSYFTATYGCTLDQNDDGTVSGIKRAVTFTEKTRFLFEIQKGITPGQTATDPYLVNKDVAPADRRVPFANMIYVGDGLTDIPCFSLVGHSGGRAFAVFDQTSQDKAKRAFREFLATRRVDAAYSPRYRPDDDLGAMLRAVVASRATDIETSRSQAT